jgi:signal transduction histidine kinase
MTPSAGSPASWIRALLGRSPSGLREGVASLGVRALVLVDPAERIACLEAEIGRLFSASRVEILLRPEGPERFSPHSTQIRDAISRVAGVLRGANQPFLGVNSAGVQIPALLQSVRATYAVPVADRDRMTGLILLDTSPVPALSAPAEEQLLAAAMQVAMVLENSALLKAKLDLQAAVSRHAEMAQLGEMAARVAHEIKNPLSSIKTIIQVMQEDVAIREHYRRDLEMIRGEIDRLSASVNQLLGYARPTPEEIESVHLGSAVRSVEQFLSRDLENAGVKIENRVPDDVPRVAGTATRIREVLYNLVLNAVQAGGAGTTILFRAREGALEDGSESFVMLSVEDDGPGIPSEVQAKVFAPFFTTRQKGTGLGLAIVKRNVEQLGGNIALLSPIKGGKGTRFEIHLPVRDSVVRKP